MFWDAVEKLGTLLAQVLSYYHEKTNLLELYIHMQKLFIA